MNHEDEAVAKELLGLERKSGERTLSDTEQRRWEELSTKLFGLEALDRHRYRRKCFRIPTKADCEVLYEGKIYPCSCVEVSYISMTLVGEVFDFSHEGDVIYLRSYKSSEKKTAVELQMKCQIIRLRAFQQAAGIGAEIHDDNSPVTREVFLDMIYKPTYFGFLEKPAANLI